MVFPAFIEEGVQRTFHLKLIMKYGDAAFIPPQDGRQQLHAQRNSGFQYLGSCIYLWRCVFANSGSSDFIIKLKP